MITETATAAVWPTRVAEQRFEQVGDGRLAERPDPDRGHRDPDLAGGDVVADLLHLRQGAPGAPLPCVGHRLQPRAA